MTLELSLRHGVIERAQVWSDAMDDAMVERIAPALTGIRYENDAMAAALRALRVPQTDDLALWLKNEELG